MLSHYEKALRRSESISIANALLWSLGMAYERVTADVVKDNVINPRLRAMVLSILTNGGVDFPDA